MIAKAGQGNLPEQGKEVEQMKKRMTAAMLALVLGCSLAACGGSPEQSGSGSEESSTATTEEATEETTGAQQQNVSSGEWAEDPTAFLSGITAADYVTLPEDRSSIPVEAAKPQEVTEEAVESLINNVRSIGEEVHDGDTVNINYIGMMDGQQFQGGTANGQYLTIGSGSYIDGFESGLIGAKVGETVTLDLKFPDPYENNPDYAGKDVQFIVTVNNVYLAELPELNDEYVVGLGLHDSFGKAITTVDEYRVFVKAYMEEQYESNYNDEVYSGIMEWLDQNSTYAGELPKAMVDRYNESLVSQITDEALQYGMDLETYMTNAYGTTGDGYLSMIREAAEQQVKYLLLLGAVAEEEDLQIPDDALETKLMDILEQDGMAEQGYTSIDSFTMDERESYREYLMRLDVLEFLKKSAVITEPAVETTTDAGTEPVEEGAAEGLEEIIEDAAEQQTAQ